MRGGKEGSSSAGLSSGPCRAPTGLAWPFLPWGCMCMRRAGKGAPEEGRRRKVAFSQRGGHPPRRATGLTAKGLPGGHNKDIYRSGLLLELWFSHLVTSEKKALSEK